MAEFEETEYAAKVVEWFERRDWAVYKEVECPQGDRIVDIYAIQGEPDQPRRSHAVEVKTSFSFRVLEQAYYWKRYAKHASVAVPQGAERRARQFGQRVCAEFGIGIFEVVEGDHGPMFVKQKKTPAAGTPLKHPELYEEQKWSVAGTPDDEERWTEFDRLKERLRELVEESAPQPIELNQAVSEIDHHYKNDDRAARNLKRSIPDRAVPGVKLIWRRNTPLLYKRD